MVSKEIQLSEVRIYTTVLITEAGNILRNEFDKITDGEIRRGVVEKTIAADEAVDRFLRQELKKQYPGSQFLTEETPPSDYDLVKNSPLLWIIDSLDGQINFSRRHPNFTISVALANDSEVGLGLIHFPLTGEIFWAQQDMEGAFLNDKPIKVSEIKHIKDTLIAIDWPYNLRQRETVLKWANCFAPKIRQLKSTGSAAADLAMVAAGRIDAYIQLGTKPWDTAAGGLLVRKAGGSVTTPEKENWDQFHDRIFASNGVLHDPIADLINI